MQAISDELVAMQLRDALLLGTTEESLEQSVENALAIVVDQ